MVDDILMAVIIAVVMILALEAWKMFTGKSVGIGV